MLRIDLAATHFLNSYAGRSRGFDTFMVTMAYNNLLKFGPLLVAFWALWYTPDPADALRRTRLTSAMVACCLAAAASVALTHVLPSRPRPIIDPQVGFILPFGMTAEGWERGSSLPSDHAALFFALAGGVWSVSRRWGWLALFYALVFITLPRSYVGLHYVTDLAAGGAIGLVLVAIGNTKWVLRYFSRNVMTLESTRPDIFYPAMVLMSYQIADLFHESRALVSLMKRVFTGNW